jgi:hypothetical protein
MLSTGMGVDRKIIYHLKSLLLALQLYLRRTHKNKVNKAYCCDICASMTT